ncbi:protein Sfk1p [[Candida] jaroonii]|uniref:Protein Sfk1p n=1 Tax=[Candida] jaroonii TaxID=467808 RepID=A0ACA9YDT1_9ASCO|nr:protein Sfk1p [[Candida] jaroonii]
MLKFKVVHYYIIPLICLIVWWGMLIAMLSAWSLQGKPQYKWITIYQNPIYISDIGATNLQPLFISCVGFQAIFFIGTLVMEYFLRRHKKLQPYVSTKQPIFAIFSIVFSIISQLGILFVSIFKTTAYHSVHLSMVAVFIIFAFLTCLCNFFNSFIFGNYPQRLSPNHEKVIFGKHKWANLYMVSFFLKLAWLVGAVVFAVLFGWFMKDGKDSTSSIFEWTISFWYGLLLIFWAIDLFPSAVKHYQVRHPDEFPEKNLANVHLDPTNEEDLAKLEQISPYRSPTTLHDNV